MRASRSAVMAFALLVAIAGPAAAHEPLPWSAQVTEYTFPFGAPPDGALPCSVVCAHWFESTFDPCEDPLPPGTYVERLTPPVAPIPVGGRAAVLEVSFDSEVNWDLFVCTWPERTELGHGVNVIGDPCDSHLGANTILPVGCHEDSSRVVTPGAQVLLIAYNSADAFDAHAKSWIYYI